MDHQNIPIAQPKRFEDLKLSNREYRVLSSIWKILMAGIGVMLISLFLMLYYLIFYSFVYDTCLFYHAYLMNYPLSIFILTIGVVLGFNLIFQFTLSVLVSPGYTSDLFKSHQQASNGNSEYAPFIYDPSRCQYNSSMVMVKLDSNTLGYCKVCLLPKPPRTHHCSVCDRCVFKMDHHCPWINGCVGYQNHRHFALFLLYVTLSTSYVTLLNLPILVTDSFDQVYHMRSEWFQLAWPLDLSISIALLGFSAWSWYLILSGQTTIEYWGKKSRGKSDAYNYSSYTRDNVRMVFGDIQNWYEILLPSVRDLVSNGVVWPQSKKETQSDEEETIVVQDQQDIKREEFSELL